MAEKFPKYYQRERVENDKESGKRGEKVGWLRGFLDRVERWKRQTCYIHEIHAQEPQFNISEELKKRQGPMIEVGGPTEDGFRLVPTEAMRDIRDRFHISNSDDGLYARYPGERERRKEYSVDFTADATALSFPNEFLSAVFASCLPRHAVENGIAEKDKPVREPAIREAYRVLESGGLLIWQGTFWDDLKMAHSVGFEMMAHTWGLLTENDLNELINRSGANENKLRDCEWVHTQLMDIQKDDPKRHTGSDEWLRTQMTAPRYVIWRKPVNKVKK